jgi:hypothetical protein
LDLFKAVVLLFRDGSKLRDDFGARAVFQGQDDANYRQVSARRRLRHLFARDCPAHGKTYSGLSDNDVDPIDGEEIHRQVGELFKLDPSLVAKMKDILK